MNIINLDALAEKINPSNYPSEYAPVRSKSSKGPCDWSVVTALFISTALGRKLKNYNIDDFESDCETLFKEKLNKGSFWNVLRKAYFGKQDSQDQAPEKPGLFKVEPHCLLLIANEKVSKPASHIAPVLRSLLGNQKISFEVDSRLNFIEKVFLNKLISQCEEGPLSQMNEPYLPFISECFKEDIKFLSSCPRYFLAEIGNFLSLYTFLYTSQLALNISEWQAGPPKPKPLFFILDTERASSERTSITQTGWKSFVDASKMIFPLLSMLELLQLRRQSKQPLWQIAEKLQACEDDGQYKDALENYAQRFQKTRGIVKNFQEGHTALESLKNLLRLGCDQFDKSFADPKTSRFTVNAKFVNNIEENIAGGFVQIRGRGGKVLVLNQDTLLLLTNIAIGSAAQLRLKELLEAFEARGIFFDKQTQQKLVMFYERIGNVERMSDSGEAVYVRKTI